MARKEAETIHGAAVVLAQVEADFQRAGGKGRSPDFDRNRDGLVEAAIRYAKVFLKERPANGAEVSP